MAEAYEFRTQRSAVDAPLAAKPRTGSPHFRPAPPVAADAGAMVPTIFHERWWLEAATAGQYQAAELHYQGRLIGWLPYSVSRRRGFRVSVMPPLTHLLGPAIDEGKGSSNTRWLRRLDIVQQLVRQLPRLGLFSQTCHPGMREVMGFQACGFESFVQFTAEVQPAPEEDVWRRMRDKTRNVIRRASERGRVDELADPHEFARFYRTNLALARRLSYFDLDRVVPLFEAARSRDQGRILCVRDAREPREPIVAAVFQVWDRRRLWYLLSSRDPCRPGNGAVSLLIWRGMQEALRRGLIFDFDGIAGLGSARFFAGFGAELRPRYSVHRTSPGFALAGSVLAFLRGGENRNHFVGP